VVTNNQKLFEPSGSISLDMEVCWLYVNVY
jgi:hypothetical protein